MSFIKKLFGKGKKKNKEEEDIPSIPVIPEQPPTRYRGANPRLVDQPGNNGNDTSPPPSRSGSEASARAPKPVIQEEKVTTEWPTDALGEEVVASWRLVANSDGTNIPLMEDYLSLFRRRFIPSQQAVDGVPHITDSRAVAVYFARTGHPSHVLEKVHRLFVSWCLKIDKQLADVFQRKTTFESLSESSKGLTMLDILYEKCKFLPNRRWLRGTDMLQWLVKLGHILVTRYKAWVEGSARSVARDAEAEAAMEDYLETMLKYTVDICSCFGRNGRGQWKHKYDSSETSVGTNSSGGVEAKSGTSSSTSLSASVVDLAQAPFNFRGLDVATILTGILKTLNSTLRQHTLRPSLPSSSDLDVSIGGNAGDTSGDDLLGTTEEVEAEAENEKDGEVIAVSPDSSSDNLEVKGDEEKADNDGHLEAPADADSFDHKGDSVDVKATVGPSFETNNTPETSRKVLSDRQASLFLATVSAIGDVVSGDEEQQLAFQTSGGIPVLVSLIGFPSLMGDLPSDDEQNTGDAQLLSLSMSLSSMPGGDESLQVAEITRVLRQFSEEERYFLFDLQLLCVKVLCEVSWTQAHLTDLIYHSGGFERIAEMMLWTYWAFDSQTQHIPDSPPITSAVEEVQRAHKLAAEAKAPTIDRRGTVVHAAPVANSIDSSETWGVDTVADTMLPSPLEIDLSATDPLDLSSVCFFNCIYCIPLYFTSFFYCLRCVPLVAVLALCLSRFSAFLVCFSLPD